MKQAKNKKFLRRPLVRIAIALLVLFTGIIIYFAIVAIDRPPKIADLSLLSVERKDWGSQTYSFGNNWLRKSESGLWEAYLEGEPFERGVAFGQLTKELLYYQESAFFDQIRVLVPSDNYLKVLKYFIAFFNRNLDKHIIPEYKEEIYGTSFACDPSYDFIGSGYQRQLNYHAAHDIGHALQGLNLVACTSFSVWDEQSADSSLLVGRNFDFYMGDGFAENKIVCFVKPSQGHRFMMITWADLIGVVSGMNEKGLTVTLNASKSSIPVQSATPVTLLAREILQYASTIDEAYEIAKKRKLFVSESIMIGSAIDHATAIIEKSPDNLDLYRADSSRIVCSNHFQGQAFKNDAKNNENIKGSDSYSRYKRVEELLNRYHGLNVSNVSEILRDRMALGDSNAGMGNPLSINQLIAHHSVIFKPDSLIVWVSTAPWQSGKYVAYDLRKVFDIPVDQIRNHQEIYLKQRTIAADPFLKSFDYQQFLEYKKMTEELWRLKKSGEALPQGFESSYLQTNPELYLTYSHLGDYYTEMRDYAKAQKYYTLAMHKKLPGMDEHVKLEEKSKALNKKINHGHSRN